MPETLSKLFMEFYRDHYRDDLGELAQWYPNRRSLHIDYEELYQFDRDLAEDYRTKPEKVRAYAEEALYKYDFPADVSLDGANVRIGNLTESTSVREIDAKTQNGELLSVEATVREATDVRTEVTEGAFTCQRCGTVNYIPQSDGFQEPTECGGCERLGPFELDRERSEYIDVQDLVIQDLREGQTEPPETVRVRVTDDLAGEVGGGEHVTICGVVQLKQSDHRPQVVEPTVQTHSIRVEQPDPPTVETDPVTDLSSYTAAAADALATLPDGIREEETKAKLITPLLEALGWNKYDGNEFRMEYTDGKTDLRPDYALFRDGSPRPSVVVEAKQLGTELTVHESQIGNYLRVFDADHGVLTDGERFHVYENTQTEVPEKVAEVGIQSLTQADAIGLLRPQT